MERPSIRARVHAAFMDMARAHSSTNRLAVAAGVGVMVGSSPFFGFHAPIGIALGKLLRLNQVAILLGEQISLPFIAPFLVFASVQTGHVLLAGEWLSLAGAELTVEQAGEFLLAWWIGSLIVGAVLAVVLGLVTRAVLLRLRA